MTEDSKRYGIKVTFLCVPKPSIVKYELLKISELIVKLSEIVEVMLINSIA